MVEIENETPESCYKNITKGESEKITPEKIEAAFKWNGEIDTGLSEQTREVIFKIHNVRKGTEDKIVQAIKDCEFATGLKVRKLDFEIDKISIQPIVRIVFDRI